MIIKVPIEVTQTGEGLKATVKGLEEVDKSAKIAQKSVKGVSEGFASGTSKAGQFADATGKMSTQLARSVGVLGLNADAFRALDDAADLAEMGMAGLTKSAAGFNAVSVGVAGAGLAIGYAFGSWLNTFPAVQKAADSLFHSIFRFVGLAPEITASAGPIAEFSKKMAASDLEAKRRQVEGMRGQGMTTAEIAKFYGSTLTTAMKEQLGLTDKQVKLDEKRLDAAKKHREEIQKLVELMGSPKVNFRDALAVNFKKDLLGLGIATSLNLSESRASVGGGGGSALGGLMGGGIATSLNLSWSKEQQINREGEAAAAQKADENTRELIQTFDTLSSQLTNLSQTVGGFAGKLLGIAASLSSGAGGVMSGIQGWQKSSGGGLMGFLGKFSSGLGIVGSAIGAVGGLIGGIKSLFGGKSKEEKAAEAAAKAQKEADAKAAIEQAKQVKLEGLKSAQSAAESLMGRGLTGDWVGALIGKVQAALLGSGLGYMASGPLRDSQAFMGAQGAAGDVAQLLAGMRAGGAMDAGLLGAAGQGAAALKDQAIEAAKAAGLGPEEATKAGFGAMVPLLREMLNASIASGEKLSAEQQALLDEAKANGITVLADPMVESVAVQKSMLGELKRMNGSGGGSPDASFASGTRGLRLVKRDMLARIHEGEGMMVVPKEEMSRLTFRSFARGTDDEDAGTWGGRGGRLPRSPVPSGGGGTGGAVTGGSGETVEGLIQAAVATLTPITVQNPVSIQIVDQSAVKTVEGQRAFGRLCVGEVERALQQSRGSLRVMIEQISRKAVA